MGMSVDSMYIAPGYTATCWNKLNLEDESSPDWCTAIQIFEKRIRGRYLDPVDILLAEDEKIQCARNRRFGFTVLAIDCLLIETFQAFIKGMKDTRNKSKECFEDFLTTRPSFCKYFDRQSAKRFYEDFRCSILHQAEVPANCKVWSVGPLLRLDGQDMYINRTEFHNALNLEFESYLRDLAKPQRNDLRENFRKKMDFICQIDHKPAVRRTRTSAK